jgi:hypothetical protein
VRRALVVVITCLGAVAPLAATAGSPPAELQMAICRTVDAAAASNRLSPAFLTRILWQESRFDPDATSRAGAEGVAQFTPKTAIEHGLLDPRQIGPSIVHAARVLAELTIKFGNVGLAAAAYNAGARRVTTWLRGQSALPVETENYVVAVTGHTAAEWALGSPPNPRDDRSCAVVVASLGGSTPPRLPVWLSRLERRFLSALASDQTGRESIATESTRAVEGLCQAIRSLGARCTVY